MKARLGLTASQAATLFSTNSLCSRLGDETFQTARFEMKERLGIDAAQATSLFSTSGLCSRLGDETFQTALFEMKERLGIDAAQATTLFSTNSLCSRLGDERNIPNGAFRDEGATRDRRSSSHHPLFYGQSVLSSW